MLIDNLISRFKLVKNRNPLHANELLDYVQKCYIEEEITIVEYKNIYFELDKRKAEKPQFYFMSFSPYENMIIPS
ncbi:MAG TPA: YppF family protein [Bacillus sp. (in: firmicutes)]